MEREDEGRCMERKKEKAVSGEKAVWSKLSTFWCRKDGVIEHIGEEGGGTEGQQSGPTSDGEVVMIFVSHDKAAKESIAFEEGLNRPVHDLEKQSLQALPVCQIGRAHV